jgi:glycosyltransferase involved in cell wall biosynthesis
MRILFALPGLHRYDRGAEIAFTTIAQGLASSGDEVTLIGSGPRRHGTAYRFLRAASARREHFEVLPKFWLLRNEYRYEEMTFGAALLGKFKPSDYDVTLTCSFPFTNWVLRRPVLLGARPCHVFVTQNGDWPAYARNEEYRFFGCNGLVCTNPEFYDRNRNRWRCRLIPNGADCGRFFPGPAERERFSLPADRLIVLMVSALIPSKRVRIGIEAVRHLPDAHLVVAGDGPLRSSVDAAAAELIPGRFTRFTVDPALMPALYRAADVYLHLSRDEPSSLAIVEAMASGLPIIAHDLPRMRYIVGDDEFLMDTTSAVAVAEQINRARYNTPAQAIERAKKAKAFAWPNIVKMYRSFLQEIVCEGWG